MQYYPEARLTMINGDQNCRLFHNEGFVKINVYSANIHQHKPDELYGYSAQNVPKAAQGPHNYALVN